MKADMTDCCDYCDYCDYRDYLMCTRSSPSVTARTLVISLVINMYGIVLRFVFQNQTANQHPAFLKSYILEVRRL